MRATTDRPRRPRLRSRSSRNALLATLFAIALSVSGIAAPESSAQPEPVRAMSVPDGPAPAWLLADLDTGQVLAAREPHVHRAPASTIKVLLAIVALDQLPLNATVRAGAAAADEVCSCAGIRPGRVYSTRQLLDAVLLISGNDAANTLADMLGGRQVTVAKMNAKAYQIGARNTRVTSPSGLDVPGVDMVTTPHDLALIFRTALRYPAFVNIISQPWTMFPSDNGFRQIVNQNELLKRYPGTIGGKTGYTKIARKTYVGAAQRNGRRLVIVQMGGMDQPGRTYWDQAVDLFNWGFSQYR
ncbi:D-alanyl-D-alanine carboxypeptidase family protein [Mycolicibacterium thermoresistibile]